MIDLRDTDKSRYFAITEFNNCFIIRSPSLFFIIIKDVKSLSDSSGKRSVIFTQERGLNYARAEYYLQQKTLESIVDEQTIICRQLFSSHVVFSRPMKRKKYAWNDNPI